MIFRIKDQTLHRIDPRLFGQFMERPSWGEIGPEAAVTPGSRDLQPAVLKLLREMEIPILRFPGGTDADFLDWRDMVGNVPGRGTDRPVSRGHQGHEVTNNFGYDEFLRLREDLKSEAIIVVNLRDALLKKKPLKEAAAHAAALVAYCNAPVGTKLPEGMLDWPAVRAKNGREKPYGVKHWQLGNETWFFLKELKTLVPDDPEGHYLQCVRAYVAAMSAVDPSIRFIIDGPDLGGVVERARKELTDKISHVVFHIYRPWGIGKITRGDQEVPVEKLSGEDIWYAWVTVPDIDEHGLSVVNDGVMGQARKNGYKVAVTEWNWNGGWWGHREAQRPVPALDSRLAKGIGAAGFVHALMRSADVIEIGCQSMLVGRGWDIDAIRVDPKAQQPPYFMPSGQVTMLYSKHHGDRLLKMDSANVPTFSQPFRMGGIAPHAKVACVDALATASDRAVFFHAINRHFSTPLEVTIDLSAFGDLGGEATHHTLEGRLKDQPGPGESPQSAEFHQRRVKLEGNTLKLTLPNRSVSCVEIRRKPVR